MNYFATHAELEELRAQVNALQEQVNKMTPGLTALQAEQAALAKSVAQNTTVTGSVQTLLTGLGTQIQNITAQLVAAGSEDPAVAAATAALTELQTTLDTNNASMSAAVAANTPASTAPGGPPSPPVITPTPVTATPPASS
jgi:small-conductance mechanosensitive channel